jgi:hypothetical protein
MPAKRAPKAAAEKRSKAYTVRYNDEEDALVADAARGRSLEIASWIRMVTVDAARADLEARPRRGRA